MRFEEVNREKIKFYEIANTRNTIPAMGMWVFAAGI